VKSLIERRLAPFVGARFHGAHCAASMLMAGFGPLVDLPWSDGRTLSVPRFALHVQAAWRLVEGNRVLVGFDDELAPPRAHADRPANTLHEDTTLCDELWSELRARLARERIVFKSVVADRLGGIVIVLSKKLELSVYPSSSRGLEEEQWRSFAYDGPDPHFIVGGAQSSVKRAQ
jgi:hypothetical protein